MCIYISMSIIEKVFKYEATELPVIKYEDEIWFKAVVVATILKYTNQRKAIRTLFLDTSFQARIS